MTSDLSSILIGFSILFYLLGFFPYIYHIYHGKVCPHPFSWTVWCVISMINTVWLFMTPDIGASIIPPILRTLCLFCGAVIGWFFIQRVHITRFDYVCILLACVTIVIAYRYGISEAIIPTILIDMLVLSPTLKKIWESPESEDITAWVATIFSQLFFLLSLSGMSFESMLFWIYVLSANIFVTIFIILRTRYTKRWQYRLRKFLSFFALENKL